MNTVFSVRDVARFFGLKESRLRYWAQTGFINPSAKTEGRRVYTFGDLIEVKAAKELLDNGIPLQRVRRNLQALRRALPGQENLLGRLRVRSDGETLVVVEGQAQLDPVSGQALLDFDIADLDKQLADILQLPRPHVGLDSCGDAPELATKTGDGGMQRRVAVVAEVGERSAYGWLRRGLQLDAEPDAEEEAMAAYSEAIRLDPGLAAAHTNLGNLYFRRGQRSDALRCYETACALDPDQPEARYNLANIYEEEGEIDLAIAEYRRALKLQPDFADAHFNLALTLEQVGGRLQAMTHWQRYLDLTAMDAKNVSTWRDVARRHLEQLKRSTNT